MTRSVRTYLTWLARVSLALYFLAAAVTKLIGIERQIVLFDRIGWGHWFRYFTGGTELVAAVLLLIPAIGFLGATATGVISVGALITLIALGKSVFPAIATLGLSGGLMLALRHQIPPFLTRARVL